MGSTGPITGTARGAAALALVLVGGGLLVFRCTPSGAASQGAVMEVQLPQPRTTGSVSVEEALHRRRSIRTFRSDSVDLGVVSQLLWAAQGMSGDRGLRTAPSAGALYPLEVFLVAGAVEGLPAGIYRYRPAGHRLERVRAGDHRGEIARGALGQAWMADAPLTILVAAVFSRTRARYGDRGDRYVHMEVGHAAQNIYLQAEALELGTTVVGAFRDDAVARAAALRTEESPMVLLPVGVPR
jgi:SagB-type dehydrogenase family enzyme